MSMMFPHDPWQLLVFIISAMLIMNYCSATFGWRGVCLQLKGHDY